MNFRTTIVLLVLLAGIGVYLLFTRGGSPSGPPKASDDKLIDMDSMSVTTLSITPRDGERVVFEREGTDWRLTEPVKGAAESFQVEGLIRDLLDLRSRDKIDAAKSASAGLEPPAYRVELTGKNKSVTLAVGNKTGVGDNLYVRIEGRGHGDVVSASLYDELQKPVKDFRQTRIVSVPQDKISDIAISRPEGALELHRSGDEWRVVRPGPMPADLQAASDLLFAVSGLTAVDFVAEDAADAARYGLDKPVLTVTIGTEGPATAASVSRPATGATSATTAPAPSTQPVAATIKFGRFEDVRKKNVFAMVEPGGPVVTVPAATLDAFRKTPLDLRDRKVIDVTPDRVEEISLKIDRPAATNPSAPGAPSKQIDLRRRAESAAAGPPAPAAVPMVQPSSAPATAVAATEPVSQPATTMAASQPAPPPSKWLRLSDPRGDADDAQVAALLDALHPLRVEKYLERLPDTRPATTYVLRVTEGTGEAAKIDELRLIDPGAPAALTGSYGELSFEVERAILDKLTADFLPRPATAAPPANLSDFPPRLPSRRPPMRR